MKAKTLTGCCFGHHAVLPTDVVLGTMQCYQQMLFWAPCSVTNRCCFGHHAVLPTSALTGEDKAIPLQSWTDPEGSRNLRLPDFKTIGTWRW